MNATYNTKLTAEQKADLKEYKKGLANTGAMIIFIKETTIALKPTGYGGYYIGKAIASKREQKLRAKVGMLYALERAYCEERIISNKVLGQIMEAAEYYVEDTQWYYVNPNKPKDFNVVRYL